MAGIDIFNKEKSIPMIDALIHGFAPHPQYSVVNKPKNPMTSRLVYRVALWDYLGKNLDFTWTG